MTEKMKIVYRDINEIQLLEKNFKRHALDEAEASVNTRGFIDPIGVNPRTGNAFDGNGRTKVCRAMHKAWLEDKTKPVPRMIQVKGTTWLVPTVDVEFTEDEEVAAAAALNQIGLLGGYDEAFQLEILQEMKEKGTNVATGFTDADLKDLVKRFGKETAPKNPTGSDADLAALSGAPDNGGGSGLAAPAGNSTVKQVQLYYEPAVHLEFINLSLALAKPLESDNASDTVLKALRKCAKDFGVNADETTNSEAGTE